MNSDIEQIKTLYTRRAALYHWLFIDLLGYGKRIERWFHSSELLHSNMKVLDLGCGTGVLTRAVNAVSREKGCRNILFHGCDITQAMLDIFHAWIQKQGHMQISLMRANALSLTTLPADWDNYDLVMTSGMFEYLSNDEIIEVVHQARQRAKPGATFLVFITRKNVITRWLICRFWKCRVRGDDEIKQIFQRANLHAPTYHILPSLASGTMVVRATL